MYHKRKLVVATANKNKLQEIKNILGKFSFDIVSMKDEGINEKIKETGKTFEENALLKAKRVFDLTGETVIADDSGLETDFLNGAPGVYSSRFAGVNATDKERSKKLLELMKDVPFKERTARFICVIAVVSGKEVFFTVKGVCEGYVAFEEKGDNGFGYDPVFLVPELGKTMAQLTPQEKNKVSHRGKALKLLSNMGIWNNMKYKNFGGIYEDNRNR
jgi:XTP/dITP diphosphohydrolase